MLKKKLKIITLLMLIILTLMVPIVRAEDNDTEVQSVQATEEQANQNTSISETYKQGDVYLTGDEVTIDYIVDGNLFVFANTVNINSQIGGDAFIVANNLTVSESGYIFSNLFALAPNVTINGEVYDLYSYSNSVNINGYIYRDVRISTNDFTLSGIIARNAYLTVDKINISNSSTDEEGNTVTSQGSISGDLNYTSKQELSIPEGSVLGSTNYTQATSSSPSIQTYILSLGKFLVTVVIIWLLCLWIAPKFLNRTNDIISKKLPSTIGLGILTPIVLIVVSVILLLLEITITISSIGLITLFMLCLISSAIFVITINNLICQRLKIEKTIGKLGVLILTAIIIWLIALIPVIGGIMSIVSVILGIGILINSILLSRKNNLLENNSKKSKLAKTKTENSNKDNKNIKNKKAKK